MTKTKWTWNKIAAILLASALVFEQSPLLYAQNLDAKQTDGNSYVTGLDGENGEEIPEDTEIFDESEENVAEDIAEGIAGEDDTAQVMDGEITIDEDMVSVIPDQVYTGFQIQPEPVVAYNGHTLEKGLDYTVSYGKNIEVGKLAGTITVKGIGSYKTKPSIVKSFNIVKCNVATSPDIEITGVEDTAFRGVPITPVKVFLNGVNVTNDQAVVSYSKNNRVGSCKVTVKGVKNLTGKITKTFKITRQDISDASIIAEPIPEQDYEEKFIKPEIVLRNTFAENAALVLNKDYTVTYKNNLMPTGDGDPAVAVVKGIGNYVGMREIPFSIAGMDISGLSIGVIPEQTYTGYEIEPDVIVTNGKRTLRKSIDYIVKYVDNVNQGYAKVIISGRTGTIYEQSSATTSFKINPADLGSADLIHFGDITNNGPNTYKQNEKLLQVRMKNGYILEQNKDYKISYTNNYASGDSAVTATMTIESLTDNLTGKITKTFRIIKGKKLLNDYNSNHITVEGFHSDRKYIYDTSDKREGADYSISPNISVKYDGVLLKKGVDYTLSYKDNNAIGTAKVVITAVSTSGYSGVREEEFYIIGKPIFALNDVDNPFKSVMPGDQVYTGAPICPKLDLKTRIIKRNGDKVYSGLVQGRDYEVEYKDNIDIGEAKGIARGKGVYSDDIDNTIEIRFNIVPRQMENVTLPKIPDQVYTGEQICPDVYLTNTGNYMIEGRDYTVEYDENIDVGIGTVRFIAAEDNPNYEGETTVNFKIVPRNINSETTQITGLGTYRYAGEPVIPDIELSVDGRVIPEEEYVVTCTKNNAVGTAGVVIQARTGSSNYKGKIKTSFQIIGADLGITDTTPLVSYPYSGKNIKPVIPTLVNGNGETMVNGVDYKLKVEKHSEVGVYPVEIIGLRDYAKSAATVYYEITTCEVTPDNLVMKPVKNTSMKGRYDVRPSLSLKVKGKGLKKGKDYLVTYLNNTSPGTATASIRFIGNYTGQASTTFTILN